MCVQMSCGGTEQTGDIGTVVVVLSFSVAFWLSLLLLRMWSTFCKFFATHGLLVTLTITAKKPNCAGYTNLSFFYWLLKACLLQTDEK